MEQTCCSWMGCKWTRHVVVGWGVSGLRHVVGWGVSGLDML